MTDTKPTESQCGTWQRRPETRPSHHRVQSVLPAFPIHHDSDLQLRMAVVHPRLFSTRPCRPAYVLPLRVPDGGAAGQDAIIKDVVKEHSDRSHQRQQLGISCTSEYFRPNCLDDPGTPVNECATTANSARNIIAIRISDYEVPFVASDIDGGLGQRRNVFGYRHGQGRTVPRRPHRAGTRNRSPRSWRAYKCRHFSCVVAPTSGAGMRGARRCSNSPLLSRSCLPFRSVPLSWASPWSAF